MRTEQPPDMLYIYCLDGLFPRDSEVELGGCFLGNWEEGTSSFLFFSEPAEDLIQRVVTEDKGLRLIDSYSFPYHEWLGAQFERLNIEEFEICPPWEQAGAVDGGSVRILLNPGVVFGSGLHPTTRDCLRGLSWVWKRDRPRTILDLGTGTGVLAVAAVSMGVERAVALDVNPLCVKTARSNVELNRLESRIETICASAERAMDREGDLVTANLHFDVIRRLLDSEAFFARRWIVFSGLMRSQVRAVKERLSRRGLRIAHEWDHDMVWYTLVVRGQDNYQGKEG